VELLSAKQRREQYIRNSNKRVNQWSLTKQEAFKKAVERITGKKYE
jgi:hypothetical protein